MIVFYCGSVKYSTQGAHRRKVWHDVMVLPECVNPVLGLAQLENIQIFYFRKFYFTQVQLICSVVLIPAVEQHDSVLYTYLYIYVYIYINTFLFIFFSIMVYHRMFIQFPMLYSKILLFTHSVYNRLHLLTPNSQSIPLHPPSHLAAPVLSVSESVSVAQMKFTCVIFQVSHVSDIIWYLSFCDLLYLVCLSLGPSIHTSTSGIILLIFYI